MVCAPRLRKHRLWWPWKWSPRISDHGKHDWHAQMLSSEVHHHVLTGDTLPTGCSQPVAEGCCGSPGLPSTLRTVLTLTSLFDKDRTHPTVWTLPPSSSVAVLLMSSFVSYLPHICFSENPELPPWYFWWIFWRRDEQAREYLTQLFCRSIDYLT